MYKLIPLSLQQILNRYPRRLRYHTRDIVRRDTIMQHRKRGFSVLFQTLAVLRQLSLEIWDGGESEARGAFVLAFALCDLELKLCVFEAFLGIFDVVETSALCAVCQPRRSALKIQDKKQGKGKVP